jgi:hypothetical protein
VNPFMAATTAAAAMILLLIAGIGILTLAGRRLDKYRDDHGVPVEGPARPRRTSRAWLSAVLSGGVTVEQVKRHDVRKVQRRRLGRPS